MTGLTLEQAQSRYKLYLDAEAKVLAGQRYQIENQELERASLEDIQKGVKYWENKCIEIARGGKKIRTMRIIPRDL